MCIARNPDELISTVAGADSGLEPELGRRNRRAAETRLRLFRAALGLFAERGFSSVTVQEITEAADVGKGTFFNYFESKDHILGVMAEIQLSKVHEAVRLSLTGKHSIRSVLHHLALRLVEEPGRSPGLARAVISAFSASDVVRSMIQSQLSIGLDLVAKCIEQGQKNGEINPRLKKRTMAIQFQQSVMGTILLWSLHGQSSLANWIEESFEHFWRAVAVTDKEERV
jgi:AcrR family transcriptional regulator